MLNHILWKELFINIIFNIHKHFIIYSDTYSIHGISAVYYTVLVIQCITNTLSVTVLHCNTVL